jgi:hypothetical protein
MTVLDRCDAFPMRDEIRALIRGINYFADLRLTFRQQIFLQNWFRNEFGVRVRVRIRVRVRVDVWSRVSVSKTVALLRFVTLRPAK